MRVRRLLLAAIIAALLHVLFLEMDPDWLKSGIVPRSAPGVIALTLAYNQPQAPEHSHPLKSRITRKKRPASVPKGKVKHVTRPKARPAHEIEKIKTPEKPLYDLGEGAKDIQEKEGSEDQIEVATIRSGQAGLEALPFYLKNPPPKYPRLAKMRGYQGTVVLEVLVDQIGRVDDIRILRSSGHHILDRAATASVKEWQFVPGKRGGEKVEMWVRVPIRFELE
jgi:protein TonB